MGKKPRINEDDLKSNPLVTDSFKILVIELKDESLKKDKDGVWLPYARFADMEANTKVYRNPDYRKLVSYMSASGKSLYLWIIYEIEPGKDWLWVNKDRYMEENRVSSINTYKSAIKELCTHLIISPTLYKDTYWINPRIAYNGNRCWKYERNVVRWEDRDKDNE
jgi:hypothetical protein